MRLLLLLLPLLLLCVAHRAEADRRLVTLESLLREMIDRNAIARWPMPAYRSAQASSYDRRSVRPDDPEGWFANNDWSQFIRSEMHGDRREWVLMDAEGPGCVTRIWWGGMMPPKERRVRFYLDGANTPAIEAPAHDLLVGSALVSRPLAIENARGAPGAPGGMNLFLPIPYARRCKITWDDVNPHDPAQPPENRWYNIEYRTYASGTPVETFTMAALERARSLVTQVCHTLDAPQDDRQGREAALDTTIPPGGETALGLPPGPAAIRFLECRLFPGTGPDYDRQLRALVLRIVFDDEQTVWCPVSDFFGSGQGLNQLHNWHRTVTADGRLACRWVMPYARAAQISLLNLGEHPLPVRLTARVGDWRWDDRSLLFHATWRYQYPLATRPFSDWNYVTAEGQGLYLGDTLTVFNPVPDWWGEGDEKIRVDGEPFPSHFGTGSEDYYGYSYGDTHLFQGPFSSQVRCDGPGNRGITVVTRTRSLDAIPFTRSLRFDMEVWHWADCRVGYAVASYWYARPGATHNRPPEPGEAVAPLPQIPPPYRVEGAIECEGMEVMGHTPDLPIETQNAGLTAGAWSGGTQLFVRGRQAGDYVELAIPVTGEEPRKVTLYATKSWDYGILRFSIDGKRAGPDYDAYSEKAVASGPIALGVFTPSHGRLVLRVEVVGGNPAARGTRAYFGLDCMKVSSL